MADHALTMLAEVAAGIRRGGSGALTWAWDDFTHAVLATIPVSAAEPTLELLEGAFTERYTADSLTDEARPLAAASGGLYAGQLLFASPQENGVRLVCAWWPWGNGQTISVRIRLVDTSVSPADVPEQPLRAWFGV